MDVAVRRAGVPLRDRGPGSGPPALVLNPDRAALDLLETLRDQRRPGSHLPARRAVREARSAAALSAPPERSRAPQPEPAPGAVPNPRGRAMAAGLPRVLRRRLDRRPTPSSTFADAVPGRRVVAARVRLPRLARAVRRTSRRTRGRGDRRGSRGRQATRSRPTKMPTRPSRPTSTIAGSRSCPGSASTGRCGRSTSTTSRTTPPDG